MAPEHVEYVRRTHPAASPKTATLARLAASIGSTRGSLAARMAALDVGRVPLRPWEEVVDPGGATSTRSSRARPTSSRSSTGWSSN